MHGGYAWFSVSVRGMASQDLSTLLASIGSPLVDGVGEAPKTVLPASAALELLDARIEALASPAEAEQASSTPSDKEPPEEVCEYSSLTWKIISEDLIHVLEQYKVATRNYAHASRVSTIVSAMTQALTQVAVVQQSLRDHDNEAMDTALTSAASALKEVGIEVNWSQGTVKKTSVGPIPQGVVMDELIHVCEDIIGKLRSSTHSPTESGLFIEDRTPESFTLKIERPQDIEWSVRSGLVDAHAAYLSRILNDVFKTMLQTNFQWSVMSSDVGLLLHRTSDVPDLSRGGTLTQIQSVLSAVRDVMASPSQASNQAKSHFGQLQLLVSRQSIPALLTLIKTHIPASLPVLETTEDMLICKDRLTMLIMDFHKSLVEMSYVSDAKAPRAKLYKGAPEPLSDLPTWARSMEHLCKQHMLGSILEQARNVIARTEDKSWDTVLTDMEAPVRAHDTTEPPRPPDVKPTPTQVKQPTEPVLPPPPTKTQPAVTKKSKKPTLGGVKIGAKLPPAPPPKPASPPSSNQVKDEWDWGDEEAEDWEDTAATSAKDKQPAADDWDWGEGEEEEEDMAEAKPEKPHEEPKTDVSVPPPDDASFDAWDWKEEESMDLFSKSDQAICLQTLAVSNRIIEFCALLSRQWAHIEGDVPSRQLFAQGFVESVQMFRALMPILHAQVLQHVPLLGMLFANDCAYLASELRKYASQSTKFGAFRVMGRQMFEASLRAEADLLDDMTTQWCASLVSLQMNVLNDSLDSADGFVRTSDESRYHVCQRAVEQVGHILSHLASVWRPVLSHDMLTSTLCELFDGVFLRVLHEVEELQDISEPESNSLSQLCRMLVDTASEVLQGAEAHIPTYFKFAYLPDILQGSLADIEYLLFDNESGSALNDYSREEMTVLIRALFADTPNRRRLLDRVQ